MKLPCWYPILFWRACAGQLRHRPLLRIGLLMMLLCISSAHAGSRGYHLVFVDISGPAWMDGVERMLALRALTTVPGRDGCWSCEKRVDDTGIAVLYVRRLPPGLDADAVRWAVRRGGEPLRQLQQRLREFVDNDGTRLDGLYAYDRSTHGVMLYAVSPKQGTQTTRLYRATRTPLGMAALDDMLEMQAKTLPFTP